MADSADVAGALAAEWDERYTSLGAKIPDGRPNQVLITAARDLTPSRALEIGCGTGGDAIWLAGQGWKVTALDVSQVVLDRAARAGRQAGVHVEWVCARLEDAPLPAGGFDLVAAHYPRAASLAWARRAAGTSRGRCARGHAARRAPRRRGRGEGEVIRVRHHRLPQPRRRAARVTQAGLTSGPEPPRSRAPR
ncbi:class I SAM-dependent methyltransferase [Mycolicibacterium pyrenivorans]|uniref:class I SAM-dependent methyltransferase n=1 Tax=Mycolicibacterium pyrenivorans TaxID=187102 RepID=UPI0021F306EC|nr:class I SAM-dependent methyltransferase [Mycolicibacterium pyrenivorans]